MRNPFLRISAAVGCMVIVANGAALARDLTFEERVAAQEAIERVYYSHQIGATKSFEEAVPARVLAAKVQAYLDKSLLLEARLNRPITSEMLQAEEERISRSSRLPDRLREIYAALGNDPGRILECFVRPALVERLIPESGEPGEGRDSPLQPANRAGAESVAACGVDVWQPMSTVNAPSMVNYPGGITPYFSSVWTGSVLIVWGVDGSGNPSGGRYNPASDSWTATTETGAPPPRRGAMAVWTGRYMVVWGGQIADSTGGRYDPIADTWLPTTTLSAPSPRYQHTAVWTGGQMVVWGGVDPTQGGMQGLNTGGRYDPEADAWSGMTTSGAPRGRSWHTAIWSGNRMIVWGGMGGAPVNSGGVYDPATDTWTATSMIGVPVARWDHSAVWTGSEMIVWGGYNDFLGQWYNTGGRYDPVTDSWRPTSIVGTPSAREGQTAVWDGARMIVWGGLVSENAGTGGRYDPSQDSWKPTSTLNAPSNATRRGHAAVWTGSQMLIWGGGNLNSGGRYFGDTATLDLDQDGYTICAGDCNDGNPDVHPGALEVCNGIDDNCDGRVDEGGNALCDDGNPCTQDTCNLTCSHDSGGLEGSPCSDANACTQSDSCRAGVCVGADPVSCSVANDCEDAGVCVPLTGACSPPVPRPDGTACDDGRSCTRGDTCRSGTCVGGPLANPPSISVTLSPAILLPANHKMVDVTATVVALDACGAPLSSILTAIASSEPDSASGGGDGNTTGDIQGAEIGTADFSFLLRAERDAAGPGRTYTVTYRAIDSSGNASTATATVLVPHALSGLAGRRHGAKHWKGARPTAEPSP